MDILEAAKAYARERGISLHEGLQAFMQIVVLKNLMFGKARFMGGSALVLGYGSPRFSEDIDLAQITNPSRLKGDLLRAAGEIGQWMGESTRLVAPKPPGATWRLSLRLSASETINLHIDSQPYRAYTNNPILIRFPSLPLFIVPCLHLKEIMAEKIIALAGRKYLGGRDLFDLWYHWLSRPEDQKSWPEISNLLSKKIADRRLGPRNLLQVLKQRLEGKPYLARARDEWSRYLPAGLQRQSIYKQILERCRAIPKMITHGYS